MKLRGSFALKLCLCLVAIARAATPTTAPVLSASPSAVDFQYSPPEPMPQPVVVAVTTNSGTLTTISVTLTPAQGTPASLFSAPPVTGTTFQVGLDPNTLNSLVNTPAIYSATITVTASGFSPLTVPVTISIGGSLAIFGNPTSLSFNSPGPTVQTVSLLGTSGAAVGFTVTTGTSNGGAWVTVSSNANFTPATLTVTVNTLNLAASSYGGSITVTPTAGVPLVIPVTLQVGANTLGASPTGLAFDFNLGGTAPPAQVIQLSSTLTSDTYTALATSSGNWLLVNGSASAVAGTVPASLNVTVNTTGLTPGTYQGTITITDAHANTQSVGVTLIVSGLSSLANPSALSFAAQVGGPAPASQLVYIPPFVNSGFTATVNQKWLSVSPSAGNTGNQASVSVNPTGLGAGTYSGTVEIIVNTRAQSVQVTFVVSANAVLTTDNGSFIFNYFGGDPAPAPGSLNVNVSSGASQQFTFAPGVPSWLLIGASNPPLTTPAALSIALNPKTLPSGTYLAQIILVPSSGGPSIIIPVLVIVTNATAVVTTPTSLTFSASAGASPINQTLQASAITSTTFSAITSTSNGGTWLAVSPSSGTVSAVNTPITVTASATSLVEGAYDGVVMFTTDEGVVTEVPVIFNIGANSVPVTITPSTLSFAYIETGAVPAAQTLQISGSQSFTASAGTSAGGAWLAVTPTSGSGNATLSVSITPVGLIPGTYNGTITVTPNGGTAQTVAVALTVTAAATLDANPTPLAFAYTSGNPAPAAQTVAVTSAGAAVTFTAAASSSGWLSVTPTSATTPGSLSVTVNPANLGPGSYSGSINLSAGSSALQVTVAVTLTVTAPLPTIDRVVSAASYQQGAISPGEIIVVFGSGLGPTTGVSAKVDNKGFIETSLSNTQVTFNGYAAPILYSSATQINAIVPYEVAGANNASVEVTFGSAKSNSVTAPVASSAPGIFSADESGSGPGAILDSNYNLISTTNPATAGSVIQVYATGQGQTKPAGVDGLIEPSTLPLPALTLAPGVTVGGLPATIQYIGAAPSLVAGALQVNVVIPAGLPSGPAQLLLSIGGNTSQNGITVAIQ